MGILCYLGESPLLQGRQLERQANAKAKANSEVGNEQRSETIPRDIEVTLIMSARGSHAD